MHSFTKVNPATIYLFKVILVILLLTLNIFHTFFRVSIVDFEQVNVCWEVDIVVPCGGIIFQTFDNT